MGYSGQIAVLPLAGGGLHTDDPQNKIPPTDLIATNNLQMIHGLIEKAPGSLSYNQAALPSGVVGLADFWPDSITQRVVAVCRDGKVYRYRNGYLPFDEVTPIADGSPATITADEQCVLVTGGTEQTNQVRKLFIFSSSIPQVISGDTLNRHAMALPALDWTGSFQPKFGIIYRNSLWCFGNNNNPHTVYKSNALNHEDFQTNGAAEFFTIDSGYSERLIHALVYKGALYMVKYPAGLYQLIDTDPSEANWYWTKIQDEFGAASYHASAAIINDALIANQNGMVSSATAVLAFGNLKAGEVLYNLRNENFVRENMSQQSIKNRHSVYFSDKHLFLSTYQSSGGIKNDRMLAIDITSPALYKTYWADKDQPNCLILKKDNQGIPKPCYGSDDGFIYEMDREDRLVGLNGYSVDFQTPHTDLGFIGQSLQSIGTVNQYISDTTKIFDFLELDYEPTGDWDLSVDIFIDGRFSRTVTFNLSGNRSSLDAFILDQDNLDPQMNKQERQPIGSFGRRISIRAYNANAGQNVRLANFNIYFRVSDHQSEGNK